MIKITAGNPIVSAARAMLSTIADITDVAGVVTLVKVPFVPSKDIVPSTLTPATLFTTKTSNGAPDVLSTPETGGFSLVWSEPLGGWIFESAGYVSNETIYGYRVDADLGGDFIGAGLLAAPVTITGDTQFVIIPTVRVPVDGNPFTGN